ESPPGPHRLAHTAWPTPPGPHCLAHTVRTERAGPDRLGPGPRGATSAAVVLRFRRPQAKACSGLGVLVHPVEGLGHGLLPVAVETLTLVLGQLRTPPGVLGPVGDHILLTGPETHGDPCRVGSTQR